DPAVEGAHNEQAGAHRSPSRGAFVQLGQRFEKGEVSDHHDIRTSPGAGRYGRMLQAIWGRPVEPQLPFCATSGALLCQTAVLIGCEGDTTGRPPSNSEAARSPLACHRKRIAAPCPGGRASAPA